MIRPIRFLWSCEDGFDPKADWTVARRLRDAGFEVVVAGTQTPEETVEIACDEGVDLVGYGVQDDPAAAGRLLARMQERGIGHLPVVIGTALAESEVAELRAVGAQAIFHPLNVFGDTIERLRALGRLGQSPPSPF